MKVALVHDWLVRQRGGEQVLLRLAELFPAAPIYTLVHRPGSVAAAIERHSIRPSFLQRLPGGARRFRAFLPLFWRAMRAHALSAYDLVLSTSHCVAVAARTVPGQVHLCYVHSPMRYLYDQLPAYLPPALQAFAGAARLATAPLRRLDARAAQGPDHLLANSQFVAQRIARVWHRQAEVLYPPVATADFWPPSGPDPLPGRRGFVCLNALTPYKGTALCVTWASRHKEVLHVIGEGPELARLQRLAGPTVHFWPRLSQPDLKGRLARAEGLLFAGEEDFGIAPVEALAAGCPVVALARGGVPESVVAKDGQILGALFAEPNERALHAAVACLRQKWATGLLTPLACRRRAQHFAAARFDVAFLLQVQKALPPAHRDALALPVSRARAALAATPPVPEG